MPLPHFTQLQSTNVNYEAVYGGLFEITFILPTLLQEEGRDPLMLLENANSVNLPLTPAIGVSQQRFKFSTRNYMNLPDQTSVDVDINFNINQDENGAVFVGNSLRAWYDKVWNSQNGTTMYKRDIVGTIIVDHHDKKGFVIRRVTYMNCQIKSIGDIPLDWTNAGIIENVPASFVADYWVDEFIDNNYEINGNNNVNE